MWKERGGATERKSETDTEGRGGKPSKGLRDANTANTLRWREADTGRHREGCMQPENLKVDKLGGRVSRALNIQMRDSAGLDPAGLSLTLIQREVIEIASLPSSWEHGTRFPGTDNARLLEVSFPILLMLLPSLG